MSTDAKTSKTADVFKTFPEFSKLTLADRGKYEALIRDYPPVSDYSFPTLMNWWNTLNSCAVSQLDGNLVISYWMPGLEKATGVAIIGTNNIDESVCRIFDNQKSRSEPARLVHVSEFVISHMQHPELFTFKPERAYDEYVLDIAKHYPLKRTVSYRRHRIRKFMSKTEGSQVVVRSLDLGNEEGRQLLLDCVKTWPRKNTINDVTMHSDEAMLVAINDADIIGTENVCIFIDGQIHAFMLYTLPADNRYAIFSHILVNYDVPYTYDYATYAFAEWLTQQGIRYINVDSDLGVPLLRMLKLALGPCNYFRKYTIEPAPESAPQGYSS